jgi:hypothetical protein
MLSWLTIDERASGLVNIVQGTDLAQAEEMGLAESSN